MGKKFREVVSDTYWIGKKDLQDFIRDRARLISFAVMPLFMMVMMGFIFPSQNALRNVSLGIVNKDKGSSGKIFVEPLKKIKTADKKEKAFRLKRLKSKKEAKDAIKSQEISGAIVIPENFSDHLGQSRQAEVILVTDQSNPQISSLLTGVLKEIIDNMSAKTGARNVVRLVSEAPVVCGVGGDIESQKLVIKIMENKDAEAIVKPFALKTEGIVEGKPNYFEFMAPGIMAMVVVMAVMMGLAGSIAREKELGTLDGILVAPITRMAIILGKALAQTVRGLLQGSVVLLLAIVLFGVRIHGDLILVALLLILGIFSFIGAGILISALVSEQETAMTLMTTFTFPMIFLSGAFFPIQQMPEAMQYVAKILPLTYMVEALRKVIVLGAGVSSVSREIAILGTFGLAMLVFAVPAFNRVITR